MDTDVDPDLSFDDTGVCNHCLQFSANLMRRTSATRHSLDQVVRRIKERGRGRKYDAIVGVSGGVDSSYVLLKARSLGLRILAVHVDNGWNSCIAVANIERVVRACDVPFETVVLNWAHFRELQKAFLFSDLPDGEIPTDHAIFASLWATAARYRCRTILSGMNFRTESINVKNWSYGHMDGSYVKALAKEQNFRISKSFPLMTYSRLLKYTLVDDIRSVSILNYIDFNKPVVERSLKEAFGWQSYAGKHFESEYTKFYQAIYLPARFGIDKRKGHLSNLINNGSIDRNDALDILVQPPVSPAEAAYLTGFVAKKLRIPEEKLWSVEKITVDRSRFNRYQFVTFLIKRLVNLLRLFGVYPK